MLCLWCFRTEKRMGKSNDSSITAHKKSLDSYERNKILERIARFHSRNCFVPWDEELKTDLVLSLVSSRTLFYVQSQCVTKSQVNRKAWRTRKSFSALTMKTDCKLRDILENEDIFFHILNRDVVLIQTGTRRGESCKMRFLHWNDFRFQFSFSSSARELKWKTFIRLLGSVAHYSLVELVCCLRQLFTRVPKPFRHLIV